MTFVFGALELWGFYHRERRDIARRFPPLSPPPDGMTFGEHWGNLAMLRRLAIDELRARVRDAIALGYGGPYPIPV